MLTCKKPKMKIDLILYLILKWSKCHHKHRNIVVSARPSEILWHFSRIRVWRYQRGNQNAVKKGILEFFLWTVASSNRPENLLLCRLQIWSYCPYKHWYIARSVGPSEVQWHWYITRSVGPSEVQWHYSFRDVIQDDCLS